MEWSGWLYGVLAGKVHPFLSLNVALEVHVFAAWPHVAEHGEETLELGEHSVATTIILK